MRILSFAFAFLALLGLLGPSLASRASPNQVPVLDIERTCRAAEAYGMNDPKDTYRNCMLDEKEARTQLGQKWSKFKATSRRGCVPPHPIPSYVEMLTCLEMDQNTLVPYQGGGAAIGAPSSYSHDSAPARPAPAVGPRPAGSF
ncbi:MAG: hypothetical protein ACLQL2_09415 [Methylovirgula sp.]